MASNPINGLTWYIIFNTFLNVFSLHKYFQIFFEEHMLPQDFCFKMCSIIFFFLLLIYSTDVASHLGSQFS